MKNRFILASAPLLLILACVQTAAGSPPDSRNNGTDESTFSLATDPRLELMAAIQSLTSWSDFIFTRLDFSHRDDVRNHFKRFKDHPAVRWMEEKLDARTWPGNMIFLSNPPEMRVVHSFPPAMVRHIGGEDQIRRMVDLMNQFVRDTGFMKFWEDRQDFYTSISDRIKQRQSFDEFDRLLTGFFGSHGVSLVFIPVPLFHNGGTSETLKIDGQIVVYCFVGPDTIENGLPVWSDSHVRRLFFHELGHGFTNPAVDAHWDQFKAHAHLFGYIERAMRQKAYASWRAACYEHVLRACEIHLLRRAGFCGEAEADLKKCLDDGFQFVPFFLEKVEVYAEHRDRYPHFKDFIPEIVKVFDDIEPVKSDQSPGSLGISLQNEESGCIIHTVYPGSAADRAGLLKGDRFQRVNGRPADRFRNEDLRRLKSDAEPGEVWSIVVLRDGREVVAELEVPFIDHYTFRKKAR